MRREPARIRRSGAAPGARGFLDRPGSRSDHRARGRMLPVRRARCGVETHGGEVGTSAAASFGFLLSAPVRDRWRPLGGGAVVARGKTVGSGGARETLFVPRALDDQVAVAEPDRRPDGSLLIPEVRDLPVEPLVLGGKFGVVALRQLLENLGTPIGQPVDLLFDLLQSTHVGENAPNHQTIPRNLRTGSPGRVWQSGRMTNPWHRSTLDSRGLRFYHLFTFSYHV